MPLFLILKGRTRVSIKTGQRDELEERPKTTHTKSTENSFKAPFHNVKTVRPVREKGNGTREMGGLP